MKRKVDIGCGPLTQGGRPVRASASELFYREGIRAVGVDEVVDRAEAPQAEPLSRLRLEGRTAAAYLRDYDTDFWARFEKPGGQDL